MTNPIKHSGQVFTPDYLVANILDEAGYSGRDILRKHSIDNSCGDGAFLCEMVRRYCSAYREVNGSLAGVESELATYIHGIELDPAAFRCCLQNLETVAGELGIVDCTFDVVNENTLQVSRFDNRMDYVVGNPPYVRVHNLEESFEMVKRFKFSNGGMTDLYLVFFEIGLRMLCDGGKLCYITPSSWINSVAGQHLRRYILLNRNLCSVIDLEHFQPFKAATYTLISLFQKGHRDDGFEYHTYDSTRLRKRFVDVISFDDVCIDGIFYLADRATLGTLRATIRSAGTKHVTVKNGFATLADKVFISASFPFEEHVIPVLKASTGKWYKAFFPYDSKGKPLAKEMLFSVPAIREYLISRKSELLKERDETTVPAWHLFGRTQALKDVSADKYAINTCIREVRSIKLNRVAAGRGLYSGLYILSDIPFDSLSEIILSEDFVRYVASLKKYKSGGYYTFNSKDLETYLNCRIQQKIDNGELRTAPPDQQRVSAGNLTLF